MKTKQSKEEQDKNIDEDTLKEPKTRARKKASDIEEDKKLSQDEPKASKDAKKHVGKTKAIVKKRPLGIRKTLRSKHTKPIIAKDKIKKVIKQQVKRGRKPALKPETLQSQDKESGLLIPASEIKKEPVDDTSPNSRSSSPKTAGRRQRLSSDLAMMKTLLSDSQSSLVLGPRTSPYSMRSERSNSPSLFDGKNLRSGKPRKVKNNLLNEVVMKEQKKRRRLYSDSKTSDTTEIGEDCKKLKRGRSCSRDGSEISKCSDNTESDLSMSETLNDSDNSKELNKKLDKSKTDLDIDIENNVQISTIEKVPSLNIGSKLTETKPDTEPSNTKNKKKLSLKRSTSLDSDNNNSNKLKLNSIDTEEKNLSKTDLTDPESLYEARSSILTSMSKTFNSKEVSKNIRKARRGRKVGTIQRSSVTAVRPVQAKTNVVPTTVSPVSATSMITTNELTTAVVDSSDTAHETIDTLTKEINDLINDLDQNIDGDHEMDTNTNSVVSDNIPEQLQTQTVSKFYGLSKSTNKDSAVVPDNSAKVQEIISPISNETASLRNDDGENMRLHYEEDSMDRPMEGAKHEITFSSPVASIDKLMDRLKEFEEFDKRRQLESKASDGKALMVTNDVVLIPKSGDIKPLKDIQSVRSPEKPLEKENVLSCFENNSAISIVKRDQVRRSIDIDLPNSVTLIKRNSFSSRKESTSSNHSADAISIFEKTLGKDVTLTEIRKSVDKSAPQSREHVNATQMDLHQFATLHPNPPQNLVGGLDTSQISITPRVIDSKTIGKRKSRESFSRKSSDCTNEIEEKATIEKIKSPTHQLISPAVSITPTPVAIKSPEVTPMETEALPPPIETMRGIEAITASEVSKVESAKVTELPKEDISIETSIVTETPPTEIASEISDPVNQVPEIEEMETETPEKATSEINPPAEKTPETVAQITDQITELVVPPTDTVLPTAESVVPASKTAVPFTETVVAPAETPTENVSKTELEQMEIDSKPKEKQIEVSEGTKSEETKSEETKSEEIKSEETKLEETKSEMSKSEETKSKESKSEEIVEKKPVPPETVDVKPARNVKSKSARNSIESQAGPSNTLNETPESQKRKENVLRTLGLLTHKAAKEAKIEKLKEKERIYGSSYYMSNKNKAKSSSDYTGTLKTVIKLNRGGDKKKHRSSLKMTFQKSNRSGKPTPEIGEAAAEDEAYYTIERREAASVASCDGGQRKTHYSNRLNNDAEVVPEPVEPKETLNLVIPEKASSFSIHPGRLCMDQCFYCGGKFGLFDTPCHIAQIKSSERQKKVLDNEEKLTIDSCLCDACYRHVDRRANCPSYRKRPLGKPPMSTGEQPMQTSPPHNSQTEKPSSPPLEEDSEEEPPTLASTGRVSICHTEACTIVADHSIRRKWLIKMRSSVNKLLKLKYDYPGLHTIPLCGEHYRCLTPLMACVLCRRRLTKHHNVHFIHHGYLELNPHLKAAGLPVEFTERPVLCKACRYYCTLLQRPGHDDAFAVTHRRKLLQSYNIEVPPTSENDTEDPTVDDSKIKKKQRGKSKQPNSIETENSESSERTSESTPEKDKVKDTESDKEQPLEEDIESLISSNKILVPNAKSGELGPLSDGSEAEVTCEMDTPILPIDKQTELQYLLQKQNNPAQFLPKPNLTQKQRNILKIQNLSAIQKPGQQHRINDKNSKRIHKLGQIIVHKEKTDKEDLAEDCIPMLMKNISLNNECTIETIPNKRPADINTLKNKWQMSESFTQVKKNLNELSKNKDTKKTSEVKYSNPVKRLETNPSISVRELFPGEEEMNLQCNIEFNNVKGVTPEGWEKCNTMIQYDVETRKLWNELQRPYGNQSSFLRHLILLEKYFRSGDLVLSHNATPHAASYSDSVQNRLKAYDNVETPKRSEQAVSLIEFRKKPSLNGKSLLKSNQNDSDKDNKKFMPPPGVLPKPKPKSEKPKSKPLPPELIAINTPNAQGRKAIQNVLHNIQQLVKGVSASDPTEIASAPLPATIVTTKYDPPPPPPPLPPPLLPKEKERKDTPKKEDVPKKVKATSKPWRPALMPITPENLAKIAREPTQVAVDGRALPSLVQVMSAGKRFHITLQDYNKMCIMRREKLQQLQDGEKAKKQSEETTVVTEIQPSTMLGNGGTVVQNLPTEEKSDKKEMPELGQISNNAATILKNVGLKNITIAPIPPKTATITSQSITLPVVTSPSLLVASTPIKLPNLGPSVTIVSETVITPPITTHIMPKIPKSLTVIPQTVMSTAQVNPLGSSPDNPGP